MIVLYAKDSTVYAESQHVNFRVNEKALFFCLLLYAKMLVETAQISGLFSVV